MWNMGHKCWLLKSARCESPSKNTIKLGTLHTNESCRFSVVWDYFLKWERESEMTEKLSIFSSPQIYLRRKCTCAKVENTFLPGSQLNQGNLPISVLSSQCSFSSVVFGRAQQRQIHSSRLKAMERGRGRNNEKALTFSVITQNAGLCWSAGVIQLWVEGPDPPSSSSFAGLVVSFVTKDRMAAVPATREGSHKATLSRGFSKILIADLILPTFLRLTLPSVSHPTSCFKPGMECSLKVAHRGGMIGESVFID